MGTGSRVRPSGQSLTSRMSAVGMCMDSVPPWYRYCIIICNEKRLCERQVDPSATPAAPLDPSPAPSADPPTPAQAETPVCIFAGEPPQKSAQDLSLLTPVREGSSRAQEGRSSHSRTLRPEEGSWRGLGHSGPMTPTPESSQCTRYHADHPSFDLNSKYGAGTEGGGAPRVAEAGSAPLSVWDSSWR